jgi:hypothetical protein
MKLIEYYYAVIRDDRVEYCKGVDSLCDLMLEGYIPVVFAETLQKLFDMMADFY